MHMRQVIPVTFLLLSLMGLWSCTEAEAERTPPPATLCDCINIGPEGRWDMKLSSACMQQCIDAFGPELKGMEAWFKDECGYELGLPGAEPVDPTQRI